MSEPTARELVDQLGRRSRWHATPDKVDDLIDRVENVLGELLTRHTYNPECSHCLEFIAVLNKIKRRLNGEDEDAAEGKS